jgi:VWFA-related protein
MRWSVPACVLAVAALQAQPTPPQPPPQQPTFRAESNLVRVDVTVVDRHGEPVTTLTSDDFTVEEDGDPQTVESFKFVAADGQPPPGDDVSLAIRSPEHAAAEAARDDVRVFVIFWDEYHIGRFASAIHGRKALSTFVTSAFAPMDLVALMDPLLPVDALRFTRDRTETADRIRKLEGRLGVYVPTRSAIEEAQLQRRDAARVRAEVTISALKSAAVHLGSLKEGRKAIILVSEGLFALGLDEFRQLQELTEAANNNNTAIYTVDPRGLVGNSSDFLRMIAERTGAESFLSTNTPERALLQVIKDASGFYLLGYSSTKNPQDGKFHSIKVRVNRRGVTVRNRRGYWAPNPTELERARAEAAATEAIPADVTSALAVLSAARPERAVDLWVGVERGADGVAAVTAAWTTRAAAGGAPGGRAETVSITARGIGDEKVFEAPMAAGRLSFPSPPGDLQLRTLIRDREGDTIDEDTRSVTVPDYSKAALAIGLPAVYRARNAAEARAISGDAPSPAPFAGREFVRTDRLFVRFGVYGTVAADADVTAELTNRSGTPLLPLPVVAINDGEGIYQIEWPLASQARGDYLIAIDAVSGDQRARVLVPLRVVP